MPEPILSTNQRTNLFCPGCGHPIVLNMLGHVLKELNLSDQTALGLDIGCSLLAWNFLDCLTVQTHHGRTSSVMVGYKMAKPNKIALAYMGDGGAYAMGLQSLINTAHRNDPITIIVVNNGNYAMTGGQMSPTTTHGTVTTTSPRGRNKIFGAHLASANLIKNAAAEGSFVARGTTANPLQLKNLLAQAIKNQTENNNFSLIEVLSFCPTNWKTDAKGSFERVRLMAEKFPLGEIAS